MPFVCQLGCDTPYQLTNGFFLQFFGLYRTSGTDGCPRVTGIISKSLRTKSEEYKLLLMFGCLRSFWQETDDKELVAQLTWMTSQGTELENFYTTFTFDNEDGEDWANYTVEFSGSDINPPVDNYALRISVGFGRGDLGIENGQYLWEYYLPLQ